MSIGLRPDSRAQDLDVAQFVALHWALVDAQRAGAAAALGAAAGGGATDDVAATQRPAAGAESPDAAPRPGV